MSRLGAGRSDPFNNYPITLNHRSRELLDLRSASPLKGFWFQISLLYTAAFHQLLSGAAIYFNNLYQGDGGKASGESLAHHAYSLQLVNDQMRNTESATTDGVISSIIGFAATTYAVSRHRLHLIADMKSWKRHLAGLREIILLRGGIDTLKSQRFLRTMLPCMDEAPSFQLSEGLPPSTLPIPSSMTLSPFSQIELLHSSFPSNSELFNNLTQLDLESLHFTR
ncbi:uncharacterized protein RCO7_05141 [Rhynchosporium graminicola]|uniref:Uncharacterized protein n=1 Tax=Rhynchosporium graminicola TaxID=2792576 RepID=A0A1E1L6E4_9HELO|nr:uncharacterized protein RCO7_05141 [Rhynchosporium commune]